MGVGRFRRLAPAEPYEPLNLLSLFCKQSWGGTSRGQSLKAGMISS